MELIPLIPHPLTIVDPSGAVLLHQPPAGPPARCVEDRRDIGTVRLPGGVTVPLRLVGFGAVIGLPAPRPGVLHVVSRAAAQAACGRDDVVYPDGVVRDADGRPIGCRALARVPRVDAN